MLGIDSNLTRNALASDALQISALRDLVASSVNLAISLALGYTVPLSARSYRGSLSNAMARYSATPYPWLFHRFHHMRRVMVIKGLVALAASVRLSSSASSVPWRTLQYQNNRLNIIRALSLGRKRI
ncbi:hypothetical protein [Janthinobacterium lividum]|uniref:hypothetical protein n=1 Tax=Janthinobacterium lividum TaxID=29581 RepID=UPI00140E9034|nr:hypothetical protein [Janthinobacterium lividum]NHQ94039.1 hypothetical protein [Janthinobacterium lividum]